ncbi:hypothetical protein NFI96_016271 [Prochilodus magdalenae]|nr:hypothetical protein NFI96_016271 [Prochilodus magdalenae]
MAKAERFNRTLGNMIRTLPPRSQASCKTQQDKPAGNYNRAIVKVQASEIGDRFSWRKGERGKKKLLIEVSMSDDTETRCERRVRDCGDDGTGTTVGELFKMIKLPLEHPHTVPADGAVGVEVEGHQAFWTCSNKPFILVLTTVPPHTDSLGVSTKTKAGLVTEDDPLPF